MTAYGTVDGFRAAAADAHRRRSRAVGAAVAAVVVAVAFAGTARTFPRAGGEHGLDVATTRRDDAPASSAATPTPTATPTRAPAAVAPVLGASAGPGTPPSPVGTVGMVGAATPTPAVAVGPQSNPLMRTTASPSVTTCTPASLECTYDEQPYKIGHRYTIKGWYCPGATGPGSPLSFANALEADFTVEQAGRVLWSSAADYPADDGAHTLALGAADCVIWETRWTSRSNAGVALHGTYTLRLTTFAEGAHPQVQATTFTLP